MSDPRPLHALTLHQPWAFCIAESTKRVENRDWPPPRWLVGKYFAIHAGKSYDQDAAVDLAAEGIVVPPAERIATGAIVAVARLAGAARQDGECFGVGQERATEARADRWFFGPWGWLIEDVVAIAPVPCRGMQKLWRVPDDVAEQVRAAFRAARSASPEVGKPATPSPL